MSCNCKFILFIPHSEEWQGAHGKDMFFCIQPFKHVPTDFKIDLKNDVEVNKNLYTDDIRSVYVFRLQIGITATYSNGTVHCTNCIISALDQDFKKHFQNIVKYSNNAVEDLHLYLGDKLPNLYLGRIYS